MCSEKQVIKFIEQDKIDKAIEYFDQHRAKIKFYYFDEQGKNFFFHIILAIIRSIRESFLHKKYTPDYKPHLSLISKLIGHKCPLLNLDGSSPIDEFKKSLPTVTDFPHIEALNLAETTVIDQFELKKRILMHRGKKFVPCLGLIYGSKKNKKNCEVSDKWQTLDELDELPLTLHQRLTATERYTTARVDVQGAANIIVANIGFIISDIPRNLNNEHKRIFLTFPITDQNRILIGENNLGHSEDNLIKFISDQDNLRKIIGELCLKLKIDDTVSSKHKVYSVVLDIHSTKEICDSCIVQLTELQTNRSTGGFLDKIKKVLKAQNFDLPAETLFSNFKLIIRASGFEPPATSKRPSDKQGTWPRVREEFSNNIKTFYPGVILHLPPTGKLTTLLIYDENKKTLENMGKQYAESNLKSEKEALAHLQIYGFFALSRQSLFANSTYKERTVLWREKSLNPGYVELTRSEGTKCFNSPS